MPPAVAWYMVGGAVVTSRKLPLLSPASWGAATEAQVRPLSAVRSRPAAVAA
jgi:hypothetical protein